MRRVTAKPPNMLTAVSVSASTARPRIRLSGRSAPALTGGADTIISAHGNSLRALLKHLFVLSDDTITDLEIPTGNPLVITLDGQLKPTAARYLDAARATALPPLP